MTTEDENLYDVANPARQPFQGSGTPVPLRRPTQSSDQIKAALAAPVRIPTDQTICRTSSMMSGDGTYTDLTAGRAGRRPRYPYTICALFFLNLLASGALAVYFGLQIVELRSSRVSAGDCANAQA